MSGAPVKRVVYALLAILKTSCVFAAYAAATILAAIIWCIFTGKSNYSLLQGGEQKIIQILGGLIFTIIAYVFLKRKNISFFEAAGLTNTRLNAKGIIKYSLCGVLLNLLFVIILNTLPHTWTAGYGERIALSLDGGGVLITSVVILLYSPVMEEILFRGFMLNYLKKRINPSFAALFVSLLFGLSHGQAVWIVYTSVAGVVFSFIALRNRSIVPSIITHFFFNAASLVIVYLAL